MYKTKLIIGVIVFLILVMSVYGLSFKRKLDISKELVDRTQPFALETIDTRTTVLILGDSTAVGGAASPEESVPGRLSAYVHATYVENHAASGATVADLFAQIEEAQLEHYTYVLIAIGGNDIIRFHDAETESERLGQVLQQLPDAGTLIVHSAGNVGGATLFPWFMRSGYEKRTLAYHEAFEAVVAAERGRYVNLHEDPATDPFVLEPERYLANDGLHPSSVGYELWFKKITEVL